MSGKHDDLAFIRGEVYGYLRDNRDLLPVNDYVAQTIAGAVVAHIYGEWLESDETDIAIWVMENYTGLIEYTNVIKTVKRIYSEEVL